MEINPLEDSQVPETLFNTFSLYDQVSKILLFWHFAKKGIPLQSKSGCGAVG